MQSHEQIEAQYEVPGLMTDIRAALTAAGKSLETLTVDDLAPIDELHARGRQATVELATLAALPRAARVLDIGSGLGGSARYLASAYDCDVVGVDLTSSFCQAATELSAMVGLAERTRFHQANALALPFHDSSFDVVWTEHTQMNIADKRGFYGEAVRVLRPGGALVFGDVFRGPAGDAHYPTPWADDAARSWLVAPDELRALLRELGMTVLHEIDQSERLREMFAAPSCEQSSLGPHVVLRRAVPEKLKNARKSFVEHRLVSIHAVWRRNEIA